MAEIKNPYFLLYYPQKKQATRGLNDEFLIQKIGFPFPFSFEEIAQIFFNNWEDLIPKKYQHAEKYDTYIRFFFDEINSAYGLQYVDINAKGKITALSGKIDDTVWILYVKKYDQNNPRVIEASFPEKKQNVTLQISKRERKKELWTRKELELKLPESTKIQFIF